MKALNAPTNEYNYNDELQRQNDLNHKYVTDKIIKIRLIDYVKNLQAKYDTHTILKKTQKHKKFYTIYTKKMKIFEQNNNMY
jgi:hypothetical protein